MKYLKPIGNITFLCVLLGILSIFSTCSNQNNSEVNDRFIALNNELGKIIFSQATQEMDRAKGNVEGNGNRTVEVQALKEMEAIYSQMEGMIYENQISTVEDFQLYRKYWFQISDYYPQKIGAKDCCFNFYSPYIFQSLQHNYLLLLYSRYEFSPRENQFINKWKDEHRNHFGLKIPTDSIKILENFAYEIIYSD